MARALLLSYSVYMVALQGDSEQANHQEIASTMLRGDLSVYGVGVIS